MDPSRNVVFLTRVAAMAPGIYHMSKLLDQMHGKTRVTTILFYPGSIEGTTGLRFMNLKDRDALGNYRRHRRNALFAARPAALRQCHTGHSNARRDVIDGLTKSAPVLDFHHGW